MRLRNLTIIMEYNDYPLGDIIGRKFVSSHQLYAILVIKSLIYTGGKGDKPFLLLLTNISVGVGSPKC